MKKLVSIIIISAIITTVSTYAQQIASRNMPTAGYSQRYINCNALNLQVINGNNKTFDFSNLDSIDSYEVSYSAGPNNTLKLNQQGQEVFLKESSSGLMLNQISAAIEPFNKVILFNNKLPYLPKNVISTTNLSSTDSGKFSILKSEFPPEINIDSLINALAKPLLPSVAQNATIELDSIQIVLRMNINDKSIGWGKIKMNAQFTSDVIQIERKVNLTYRIIAHIQANLGFFKLPFSYDVTDLIQDQLPIENTSQTTHNFYTPTHIGEIAIGYLDETGTSYNAFDKAAVGKNARIVLEEEQGIDIISKGNHFFQIVNANQQIYKVKIVDISGRIYNLGEIQAQQFSIPQHLWNKTGFLQIYNLEGDVLHSKKTHF
ncbi:MAG: hypothetical protein MUE53_00615 [Chitinophagales bacterium]|jgi:hypothetical protein|nr:hypothetical protein [Chitinophagales bacterium]